VDEVSAWVGQDADRAAAALAVEESGKKRVTLLRRLSAIVGDGE
jgi:hypothetical protein